MVWFAFMLGIAVAGSGDESPVTSAAYKAWLDDQGALRGEMRADVAVSASRLWPALSRYERQHTWVPYMRTSSVEEAGPSGALCVGRTDLPWPLADRTWSVVMQSTVSGGPGAKTYMAAWRYVPDSGNLRDTSGSWTLRELSAERTRVELDASVDLGRSVPSALLRWAERNALPQMLHALLAQASAEPT